MEATEGRRVALSPLEISNPTLGFRLDPGEPGMLRRARASEAALQVTAQEHRNLARLKSQALSEGRVIIHAGIQYGRGFVGPYLTTTSGLTTVISREPRPNIFEAEAARPRAPREEEPEAPFEPPEPEGAKPGEAEEHTLLEAPADDGADQGYALDAAEAQLRAELGRLETPGFGLPREPAAFGAEAEERAGDDPLGPLAESAERRAGARRAQHAREVEGELRRVQFERLRRQMEGTGQPAVPLAATA